MRLRQTLVLDLPQRPFVAMELPPKVFLPVMLPEARPALRRARPLRHRLPRKERSRDTSMTPTVARNLPAAAEAPGPARLIKRVYEADPLVCPRCSGPLKIISLIGDGPVIEKILRHLKLWDRPERPPPRPAVRSIQYDEPIVELDDATQWPDATG